MTTTPEDLSQSLVVRVAKALQEGSLPYNLAAEWDRDGAAAWTQTTWASPAWHILSKCGPRVAAAASAAAARACVSACPADAHDACVRVLVALEDYSRGKADTMPATDAAFPRMHDLTPAESEAVRAIKSALQLSVEDAALHAIQARVHRAWNGVECPHEHHFTELGVIAEAIVAAVPCPTTSMLIARDDHAVGATPAP